MSSPSHVGHLEVPAEGPAGTGKKNPGSMSTSAVSLHRSELDIFPESIQSLSLRTSRLSVESLSQLPYPFSGSFKVTKGSPKQSSLSSIATLRLWHREVQKASHLVRSLEKQVYCAPSVTGANNLRSLFGISVLGVLTVSPI